MPTFEDLLERDIRCKTCTIIDTLDPKLQGEIDIAMRKGKYSNKRLATALTTVSKITVNESTISKHRAADHRR